MKRGKWFKALAIIAVAIAGWVLYVCAADLPLTEYHTYACAICRECKRSKSTCLIPTGISTWQNDFSRYYLKNVDSKHKHIWLHCAVTRYTRTGGISGHGGTGPLRLQFEVALAIIKSLPNRQTRKAFFEQLHVPNESSPEGKRTWAAIMRLNEAYWEDKNRHDWPEQVRKAGLYPKVIRH